ncbi:MAG TPA: M14 family metallopeptidase [Spirochaetota bacterium]|nr:M14 family metallopeptidase [Spirochaetota bacterium]HPV40350.1 M14 family metallopeptidase [Spirochaetota bacterium]
MKKAGFTIVAMLFLLTACSRWDDSITVRTTDLNYFKNNYRDCRVSFQANAQKVAARYDFAVRGSVAVPGGADKDLAMDYVYVPATKSKEKLLIITAGLHGIEGYAGSAVLDLFFKEVFPSMNCDATGVIVFHAVNPYGMKHFWRATEDNIDLNRNCMNDPKLYEIKNEGYARLRGFLDPEGKASAGIFAGAAVTLKMIWYNLTMGKKDFMQAALSGQHEFPKGIFYGGKKPAPQIAEMTRILSPIMARYRFAAHIDLHTGYGRRGSLHLFLTPLDDKKNRIMESLFPGHPIDWSTDKDFYQTYGDLNMFLYNLVPGLPVLPLTLEYGTLDSQTISGGIQSLKTIILGTQALCNGYASDDDRSAIQAMMMEMYYPQSPAWKSEVIRQSREVLTAFIKRWEQLQRKDF